MGSEGEAPRDIASAFASHSTASESRVLIIMTGGTICMRPTAEGLAPSRGFLDTGMATRPSFNDGNEAQELDAYPENGDRPVKLKSLRTPRSRWGRHVRYAVYEFDELLDSSSVDSKGWYQIAHTIEKNYTLYDAFVVLHGTVSTTVGNVRWPHAVGIGSGGRVVQSRSSVVPTHSRPMISHQGQYADQDLQDSLAYSSSALSFMLSNLGKPVVLTGSQAPIHELQTDATDNLLGSLIVAGHFLIPEVCLFFNHRLFRGNRCTKVSSDQFAAFASPNFAPLATITSSNIHIAWSSIHRPTEIAPFALTPNLHTAHVACLRIFPGIKPEMLAAVLSVPGLRGLVLETFGAGNAPGGPDNALIKVFSEAVSRGIVIVNVTQCLTGSVSPLYAPAAMLGRAGIVPGHDLTTEAALTKLSYLLAQSDLDHTEVIRQMSISLRGELSEPAPTHFSHAQPSAANNSRQAHLSRLAYAIASGSLAEFQEILAYEPATLLNSADYSGSTPLHVAATGSSIEILRILLQKGASVHIRNNAGRTPLFLAARAGLEDHVRLLMDSGAHLHLEERSVAKMLYEKADNDSSRKCWALAGANSD